MKTTLPKVWIFGTPLLALLFVFAPHALRSLAQDQAPPATTEQAVAPANPPAPAELPSDIVPGSPVAQVVEMAQAGVSESVIISFVNASAAPFNLTADDIIYLKDIGLSDNVVNAMIQRDQQLGVQIATPNDTPPPPPVASTAVVAQPAVVTDTYFYDNLAPYGSWVNIQGYGLCWQPTVVVLDPGWRPYCDRGHWVYTDDGWFWMSDYSWGWATFHYGRWFHHPHYGWCWWPDTVWGPSWVTWRYSNDYCGWAPLPPHAIYRSGVGIVYNGVVVGAGFDFGLGVSFYTFVPTRHFCDRDPWRYRVHDRPEVFRETVVVNRFDTRHREFQNRGIDPDHIVAVTGKPIRAVPVRETTARLPGRARLEHDALVVNRPRFAADSSLTLHQGIVPRPEPSRVETRPRVQPDT
ncbi:MAG: hypothetical protein KGR98_09715, partial [Verrucomicrobia bacterium]|nr:hypothetical protein [Verrucomicrobiota bacterium]